MLSCRDVTALASDHLDGVLPLRQRMAIRLHLLMCVHCRRFARQLRALVLSLRQRSRGILVSDEFVERVLAQLDDEPPTGTDQPLPDS
jgi:predicted anti-sigma-YlaC factor YlaD